LTRWRSRRARPSPGGPTRPRGCNELAVCALRLQRACGLRIGELLDVELDCVHEVPGQGAWLKVPLGKLESERMVPLDDEVVDLIDHIIAIRSPGQPLPHLRYRRRAQFLSAHHGRRLSPNAVREELERAAGAAGLGHTTTTSFATPTPPPWSTPACRCKH
jgi:integrase